MIKRSFNKNVSIAAISLSLSSQAVRASDVASDPVIRLGSGLPLGYGPQKSGEILEGFFDFAGQQSTYQLGDEWGKKPVGPSDLSDQPRLLRAAQATARLGGATAFYLGTFHGEPVLATNHHVCPSLKSCVGKTARFPLLQKGVKVTRSLGTWQKIDLSLVVVDIDPADLESLDQVAANFDFVTDMRPGQLLFTAGFGIALNSGRELMANQDSDCKVFSKDNEFKLMSDPDSLNPGTYQTWSFANGCDISHGDSGSAMVDRETGRPIGIIWTGKIPKSPSVQSSARLDELVGSTDDDVWNELSYGVPAIKIKEYLLQSLEAGQILPEAELTVRAILVEDTRS